jgi:enamine deaminase RidA (YjgF/YER057c/UK114 family)
MKIIFIITILLFNSAAWAKDSPEKILSKLGIVLTQKGTPTANYVYAVTTSNLVFTAGHVSVDSKGQVIKGKLGQTLTVEEGRNAARSAGISLLSTLKSELGDLSRVKRIVKVTGMVNATPNFNQHSPVINGFSDLMVEVFGEKGKHARSAVGMSSLPVDAAVEIEMIVEIE